MVGGRGCCDWQGGWWRGGHARPRRVEQAHAFSHVLHGSLAQAVSTQVGFYNEDLTF